MSDKVNWKQARVDAAISAMNGILSRRNNLPFAECEREIAVELARLSTNLADALIAELQRVKSKEE